jgi:hypothetical protein
VNEGDCGLLEVIAQYLAWTPWEKPQKSAVMISGRCARIRTGYSRHKCLDLYSDNNLAREIWKSTLCLEQRGKTTRTLSVNNPSSARIELDTFWMQDNLCAIMLNISFINPVLLSFALTHCSSCSGHILHLQIGPYSSLLVHHCYCFSTGPGIMCFGLSSREGLPLQIPSHMIIHCPHLEQGCSICGSTEVKQFWSYRNRNGNVATIRLQFHQLFFDSGLLLNKPELNFDIFRTTLKDVGVFNCGSYWTNVTHSLLVYEDKSSVASFRWNDSNVMYHKTYK